jgi:hypothetical protein
LLRRGLESFSYPCIATEFLAVDPAAPIGGRLLGSFAFSPSPAAVYSACAG